MQVRHPLATNDELLLRHATFSLYDISDVFPL